MRVLPRKKRTSRWWYSRLTLLVLAVVVVLLSRAAWNVYLKERESGAHMRAAEEKVVGLETRRIALEKKIAALKTTEGMEAEIRAQFQVAKPGERMVVVIEPKDITASTVIPTQSLLSRFFDIFRPIIR